MDNVLNVASQQQPLTNNSETQLHSASDALHTDQVRHLVEEEKIESTNDDLKINSKEDVEDLVKQLNEALSPMNTDLKFGVDHDDIFFVSVVDTKTSKMIRRFPAEQAADFLPKMQEVSGVLFDSRG